MQKTTVLKPGEFEKNWYVIDASGKTLGRLATRVASVLRGKTKPAYAPHMDTGDFVIVINGYRNFFILDEMRKIVKICHAAGSAKSAGSRLYAWFDKERIDVLRNSGLGSSRDLAFKSLYDIVIKTYAVKR